MIDFDESSLKARWRATTVILGERYPWKRLSFDRSGASVNNFQCFSKQTGFTVIQGYKDTREAYDILQTQSSSIHIQDQQIKVAKYESLINCCSGFLHEIMHVDLLTLHKSVLFNFLWNMKQQFMTILSGYFKLHHPISMIYVAFKAIVYLIALSYFQKFESITFVNPM